MIVQSQAALAPNAPVAPAGAATAVQGQGVGTPVAAPSGPHTAREMYQAMRAQRRIIHDQLDHAESERSNIAEQLRREGVTGADREGLESQIRDIDARIKDLREQHAAAERSEATAAGVPGATAPAPRNPAEAEAELVMAVSMTFIFVCLLPLTIAYARRIWKKNAVTIQLPPELDTRLHGLEQAVEATAVEVERIGEGQRFVTQLMAKRAEPVHAALEAPGGNR
ncbi:MAG: hypothetical protein KF709_11495 [Gemmatimonadaceae bacterium]|nr:hypothetical protein [Gemmatimonadaceae bacterium]